MSTTPDGITTAAGRFLPVSLYDAIVAATMREGRWRPQLADDLSDRLGPAPTIAEVGAGTGSLTRELAARIPGATITAIEPDAGARAIAAAKGGDGQADRRDDRADVGDGRADRGDDQADSRTDRADVRDGRVDWVDGRAEALPLEDGSQDAVVMALMLHHLAPDAKRLALAEAHRVIRPDGTLYVADFGRPQDPLMAAAFGVIQLADGRVSTRDHRAGRLPDFIVRAGFTAPETVDRLRTLGGTLEVLRSQRSTPPEEHARPAHRHDRQDGS